jgi:hypothetical protein
MGLFTSCFTRKAGDEYRTTIEPGNGSAITWGYFRKVAVNWESNITYLQLSLARRTISVQS